MAHDVDGWPRGGFLGSWNMVAELSRSMLAELIAKGRTTELKSGYCGEHRSGCSSAVRIAAADLYPTLSLDTTAQFTDGADRMPTVDLSPTRRSFPKGHNNQAYKLGLDLAWEADLWDAFADPLNLQKQTFRHRWKTGGDVLVTIRAEVAQSYIAARSYQAQIAAFKLPSTHKYQHWNLLSNSLTVGVASDLALAQSQASLAATQAQLPAIVDSLESSINGLSILIGEAPGPLRDSLADSKPIPQPPLEIGVGIPAETIRRRADVRMAERSLAAATANIWCSRSRSTSSFRNFGLGVAIHRRTFRSGSTNPISAARLAYN